MKPILRAAAAAFTLLLATAILAGPAAANPQPPVEGAPCVVYGEHGFWEAKNPEYPFSVYNKACRPKTVTPAAPTFGQPVCFDGSEASLSGSVTIPATEGAVYSLNGSEVDSGVHQLTPGHYEVAAEPEQGYKFPEDATDTWHETIVSPPGCPGDDGQPGTPGAPGAPGPAGQTVSAPAAATAVVGRPTFTG